MIKLDVGCSVNKQLGFIGVDIESSPHVDFVMSATDLKFGDNTVDEIYSRRCLQHIGNDGKALNEFYRVLKPDGKLTVIVSGWLAAFWCKTVFKLQYKWRTRNIRAKRYRLCHFYLESELLEMVQEAGFKNCVSTKIPSSKYPFIYDLQVVGYKPV